MKRVFLVIALIITISASACSINQPLITNTNTPEPTATFTIEPTETPTLTPSPIPFQSLCRFAGATDEQAVVIEKAILDFVDAVKNDDKEYVAEMIVYPTWVTIDDEPINIVSKYEFINYYDSIITENLKNSLSLLELNDEYIFSSWRGICLLHHDEKGQYQIWLSPNYDGKFSSITYYDFTKITPDTPIPTYTDTATKTPRTPGAPIILASPTPTNTPYQFTLTSQNEKFFSTYYGVWIITHYEYRGFSVFGSNEFADSQIGKKIELLSNEVNVDEGFLWLSKTSYKKVSYGWAEDSDFIGGGWQVLLPDENPDKHIGLLYLDFYYNDGYPFFGAEVTKTGRLVVFYDGYWFFLDKVVQP